MILRKIKRRRFLSISAAAIGVGLWHPHTSLAQQKSKMSHWTGAALGAKAEIRLYGDDSGKIQDIFSKCQNEITRLEKIFSLYHTNSTVSQLNRVGYIDNPDIDLINLLSRCLSCYQVTDGAFDVTIQPLWKLYADHFSKKGADPLGPSQNKITTCLKRVGSDKIIMDSRRISFTKPDMGISLNGVAQGYITDRISHLLKEEGYENILVHMGETYATGQHEGGRPWTAGISSPLKDNKILLKIPLDHQAIATSGGYGSPFSNQSQIHHLLNPKTGRSANHHGAVSVIAADATTADMLSTAFYVMDFDKIPTVWAKYPKIERAVFIDNKGYITNYTGHNSTESMTGNANSEDF